MIPKVATILLITKNEVMSLLVFVNIMGAYINTKTCKLTPLNCPPEQNGHHFANNIFRRIFVNENFCILIKVSMKFVPNGLN